MEKKQIIDQLVEQVKKTCEENGISVLMFTAYDHGDCIALSQLMDTKKDRHAFDMIFGIMNENPELADLIGCIYDYYISRKRQSSRSKRVEELLRELRQYVPSVGWVFRG